MTRYQQCAYDAAYRAVKGLIHMLDLPAARVERLAIHEAEHAAFSAGEDERERARLENIQMDFITNDLLVEEAQS